MPLNKFSKKPKSVSKTSNKTWIIGIQGGKGSFNEQAIHAFMAEKEISDYRLKYLYTTKNVLKALSRDEIDRGMFAIQNSLSGVVIETINALSQYNCKILESYELNISHTLFAAPGVSREEIERIMSHPVALDQCRKTLARKYSNVALEEGSGRMIDQATATKALADGKLPKTTAVLAAPYCEALFDLEVLDRKLRDNTRNFTTFLFVSRFEK